MMASSDTLIKPNPVEKTEQGEPKLTHYINPPANIHIWQPGMTAQDIVNIARVRGLEVIALCGRKFHPNRNPEEYDLCQACSAEATRLMSESGE